MPKLEILLLNYFAVFFLIIAVSIFIMRPEKILKAFSFWLLVAQMLLSLLLYKVIQIYNQFEIIYLADIICVLFYIFSKIPKNKKNKGNFDHLAKTLPKIHKLSDEELTSYITTLFKAYGFQSVRLVKIESDEKAKSIDQYLLARHEASLVEIRVLSQKKKLSEDHINSIVSSFRESTSQATIWLLVTCALADQNTPIHIRNCGADIKVFDLKAITELVYVLAPKYQPKNSIFTRYFVGFIDFILIKLSTLKNKLVPESTFIHKDGERNITPHSMSDLLNITNESNATIELFEENLAENLPLDETNKEDKIKKRKRKKDTKPILENQGNLNFNEVNTITEKSVTENDVEENEPVTLVSNNTNDNILVNSDITSSNQVSNSLELEKEVHQKQDIEPQKNDEEITLVSEDILNTTSIQTEDTLDTTPIQTEDMLEDEVIKIELVKDPLLDFDTSTINNDIKLVDDILGEFSTQFDDFPVSSTTDSQIGVDLISVDLLLTPESPNELVANAIEDKQLNDLVDIQLDLSDLGAAIPTTLKNKKE